MRIVIETIPHAAQRYETVGDYWTDPDGTLHIKVSEMVNPDHEFLVALHELVEAKLCEKRGISDAAITAFDVEFEEARGDNDLSEPGDDPMAPYQNEHCIATGVERIACAALGVRWADYESEINRLSQ